VAGLAELVGTGGLREREHGVELDPELAGVDQRGQRLEPAGVRLDQRSSSRPG
jgi:hypothetical protein